MPSDLPSARCTLLPIIVGIFFHSLEFTWFENVTSIQVSCNLVMIFIKETGKNSMHIF